MSNERSREKLLEFIDYLAEKGLMAKATAANRKAATSKVLGILSEAESSDVTKLDLDEVMTRFSNLKGKGYTPASMNTYLSRLRGAIDDFNSYLSNPLAFKPGVQVREKPRSEERPSTPERPAPTPPLSSSIVPIAIRSDVVVFVQGLPFDLSEGEAAKIANVVKAMAMPK